MTPCRLYVITGVWDANAGSTFRCKDRRVVGTPAVDVGTPAVDVGTPAVDVGTPAVDVGTSAVGVGTPAVDVGTPAVGVGTPAMEVGTPAVDVGTPAVGVGTPAVDVGTSVRAFFFCTLRLALFCHLVTLRRSVATLNAPFAPVVLITIISSSLLTSMRI